MNIKQAQKIIDSLEKEFTKAINDTLPKKVGIIAVNHTNRNFREGGFNDNGLQKWKDTRRQREGKGTDSKYGPLLSRRNHLSRSTDYRPGKGSVEIYNPVIYASIHNEGGRITTHPKITKRLKKYAWYQYFKLTGIKRNMKSKRRKQLALAAPKEALMWKAIALSKKTTLTVNATIPQRKFLGQSRELTQLAQDAVTKELARIINSKLK